MTRRITIKPARRPRGKPSAWKVQADRGNKERRYFGSDLDGLCGGGTDLDEFSVGEPCWLHIEAMNVRGTQWCLHIGDVMMGVQVKRDGSVRVVHQEGEIIR